MTLLQRARDSGVCPPSLLQEDRLSNEDGFEEAVSKILDSNGFSLGSDGNVVEDFKRVMEMAERREQEVSKEALEFRRCIILTIVGSTDVNSASLSGILENGYLNTVKTWFDQILNGSVGGVDLLLHLLTNIKNLPVTKSLVKQSGMGKAIGSIEKHPICAGTPNETPILERVQEIKSAWNSSVKARKEKDGNGEKTTAKRQIDYPTPSTSPAKKAKVEEKKKGNAFSSLLKKVSDTSPGKSAPSMGASSPPGAKSSGDADAKQGAKKSTAQARVKWADHFGGDLTAARVIDGADATSDGVKPEDTSVSWTDRKKRDRLREKELLAKAKKAKLLDDDDDDMEPASKMKPTKEWRQPSLLPDNPDVTKAQLSSKEIAVQVDRMTKVQPARYVSDEDIPSSPAPLSDVEQALDMTSVSSAVVATIPFFVPQAETPAPVAVAPAPAVPPPAASYAPPPQNIPQVPPSSSAPPSAYPPPPQSGHEAATAQTVQSLGLPLFLVGQNVQALQTLASSPSLLNTLVEPNGMYDQPRLMSLVQTLSQNMAPTQPAHGAHVGGLPGYQPPAPAPAFNGQAYPPGGGGIYGPASSTTAAAGFGQPPASPLAGGFPGAGNGPRSGGYRGDNNSDGNLHLSGYGPTTTQADIIQLFAPYVQVDEVVMKGTFSFVNTSDPIGAKNAREALSGALLGGTPIRINMAQRRNREPSRGGFGGPPPRGSTGGPDVLGPGGPAMGQRHNPPPFQKPPAFAGQADDMVRDDRGNPATKNLFVAGYGPGTTEQQLREVFGQYATVIGVVTKGTFSFVNTSDKGAAIRAREALSNSVINGGMLRINFAKETGRLGTSFDLTYGPGTGGGGGGGGGHYGRGGY